MKTNWQHQKDATITDQATRTDDEHIHEEDKQHLKASDSAERDANPGRQSDVPSPETGRKKKG